MNAFRTPDQSRTTRASRGATLVGYALLTGLIGVTAIGSVTRLGEEAAGIFCRAAGGVEKGVFGATERDCLADGAETVAEAPASGPVAPVRPDRPAETELGALYSGGNIIVPTQFRGYKFYGGAFGPWLRVNSAGLVGTWPAGVSGTYIGGGGNISVTSGLLAETGFFTNLAINGFNASGESYSEYFDVLVREPGKIWRQQSGNPIAPFGDRDDIVRMDGRDELMVGVTAAGRVVIDGYEPVGGLLFDPSFVPPGSSNQYSMEWREIPGTWSDADGNAGRMAMVDDADGSLWVMGAAFGGGPAASADPVKLEGTSGFAEIEVYSAELVVRRGSDGAVFGFGSSAPGTVYGAAPDANGLYRLDSTFSGATAVSMNAESVLAIGANGRVYGMGRCYESSIGACSTTYRHTFQEIGGGDPNGFVSVFAGGNVSVALGDDGQIYYVGKLLYNGTPYTYWRPVSGLTNVKKMAAGVGSWIYAIRADGALWRMNRSLSSVQWAQVGADTDWESTFPIGWFGAFHIKR